MSERYFIFCPECGQKAMDDNPDFEMFLAMFGPQGCTDGDQILLCVLWEDRHPLIAHLCQEFACDGCGASVSVAPSSGWFIDRHKEEREKQKA